MTTNALAQHVAALAGIPKQPTAADRSHVAPKLSVTHLMDTPLPELVDELHVVLEDSDLDMPGFTGYVYSTRDEVVVALPTHRPAFERDCMARYLIAQAFHVDDMPPLPEPYQVTDITADVNRAHRSQADEALRRIRGEAV